MVRTKIIQLKIKCQQSQNCILWERHKINQFLEDYEVKPEWRCSWRTMCKCTQSHTIGSNACARDTENIRAKPGKLTTVNLRGMWKANSFHRGNDWRGPQGLRGPVAMIQLDSWFKICLQKESRLVNPAKDHMTSPHSSFLYVYLENWSSQAEYPSGKKLF